MTPKIGLLSKSSLQVICSVVLLLCSTFNFGQESSSYFRPYCRIGHDNKGGFAGWFLDKVHINVPSLGQKVTFPCGRWLDKDKDDRLLERELLPMQDSEQSYTPRKCETSYPRVSLIVVVPIIVLNFVCLVVNVSSGVRVCVCLEVAGGIGVVERFKVEIERYYVYYNWTGKNCPSPYACRDSLCMKLCNGMNVSSLVSHHNSLILPSIVRCSV